MRVQRDRKPVGLFLVFAAIRLLGGAGIVQYQLVATLSAAATAGLVARLASRIASRRAALLAGLAYLFWIGFFVGQGGQAPVFYNLPMAAAAGLTLRAIGEPAPRGLWRRGAGAMALAGLALQIKYTAVFEGVFFGFALTWTAWRRTRRIGWAAGAAAGWAAIALLPTLAALLAYLALGQGHAFIYANFVSIGLRGHASWAVLLGRLARIGAVLMPLGLALAATAAWRRRDPDDTARLFFLWWLGAAIAGVLLFGTWYAHYALPLVAPFAVAMAPAFDIRTRRLGLSLAVLLTAGGVAGSVLVHRHVVRRRGDAAFVAAVERPIRANLSGGCLYVFDGEPILYHLAGACVPTRYLFPSHLNEQLEAPAIGTDPAEEVRAIFRRRPAVVVDTIRLARRHGDFREPNGATVLLVRQALARDYRLAAAVPLGTPRVRELRRVWVRRPADRPEPLGERVRSADAIR